MQDKEAGACRRSRVRNLTAPHNTLWHRHPFTSTFAAPTHQAQTIVNPAMNRAALCVVLVATGSPQIHAATQPDSALPASSLPVVEPNDNRAFAGRLENGVLKLTL